MILSGETGDMESLRIFEDDQFQLVCERRDRRRAKSSSGERLPDETGGDLRPGLNLQILRTERLIANNSGCF